MRPLSATLERRLRRADVSARELVEIDKITKAMIVDTYDEWGTADSLTGIERRKDGTVRLQGTSSTLVDSVTSNGGFTDLNRVSPFVMALISAGDIGSNSAINQVVARLDPDPASTGRIVDQWLCQVWLVLEILPHPRGDALAGPLGLGDRLAMVPVSSVVSVVEGGTADHDVTFAFSPTIETEFLRAPDGGGATYPNPLLLVQIWAVKNDGTAATNVEWLRDSTASSVTDGLTTLYGVALRSPAEQTTPPEEGVYELRGNAGGVPRMSVGYYGYVSDDVTFTTNPLDAGADPATNAEVRLFGHARVPPGTAVRFYTRNDADNGWVQYTNGQRATALANVDFTGAGHPRKFRVELDTDAGGDATPEVLAIGFQYLTSVQVFNVAEVESVEEIVDPFSCRGRISEIRIRGMKDGVHDFNSALEELLVQNDIADLSISVYVGHPDDDRSTWMLKNIYPILDETESDGHSHVIVAVCPLAFLRGGPNGERRLPRFDPATNTRTELIYDGTAAKNAPSEIWKDLISVQLGISADMWVGAPPDDLTLTYLDDASPPVSQSYNLSTGTDLKKRIADSEGHDEVDAISIVSGFATTSTRGKIRAVRMRGGEGPIRAIFSADEISWVGPVSPGFRHRTPVRFTEYNFWDSPDDPDEVRAFHQNAIDNIGGGRIQSIERTPQIVGSWIAAKALAEAVGAREIAAFGTGIISWEFASSVPYPELEVGDRVALEVDRFLGRDPNAARELRGALWAVARIVGVLDVMGTRFKVWIENWADIFGAHKVVTRTRLDELARVQIYKSGSENVSGGGGGAVGSVSFDSEAFDIGGFHDNVTSNELVTVPPGYGRVYSLAMRVNVSAVSGNLQAILQHMPSTTTLWRTSFAATRIVDISLPAIELAAGEGVRLRWSLGAGETATFSGGNETEHTMILVRMVPGGRPVSGKPSAIAPRHGGWRWRPR